MSESVLIRIARGEPAAVAECIDQFGPLVWALARRFSPDRAEAEDAVQEVFMDVWRSAARFNPAAGSDKAFVATIARRRLIDRLRRRAQHPPLASIDELETVGFADPGTAGEISIEAERAATAIAELKEDQQRVIELAVIHGLAHSEIAARTGLPLGTVKTQMRRGLMRVRELLGVEALATRGDGP